jgi:hypothetical protein
MLGEFDAVIEVTINLHRPVHERLHIQYRHEFALWCAYRQIAGINNYVRVPELDRRTIEDVGSAVVSHWYTWRIEN